MIKNILSIITIMAFSISTFAISEKYESQLNRFEKAVIFTDPLTESGDVIAILQNKIYFFQELPFNGFLVAVGNPEGYNYDLIKFRAEQIAKNGYSSEMKANRNASVFPNASFLPSGVGGAVFGGLATVLPLLIGTVLFPVIAPTAGMIFCASIVAPAVFDFALVRYSNSDNQACYNEIGNVITALEDQLSENKFVEIRSSNTVILEIIYSLIRD